jgi:hypothetical protein
MSRLLNGKRLIALSGVRDAAAATAATSVLLAVGPANTDGGNHGYLGQRGGLHGGWGGSRSLLQAQLREPTLDCVGHSVLFPDTSSSLMGLLPRACDLP